jgi:hypothetical protein
MLIMEIGLLPDRFAGGRHGFGISRRQNAVDPGFHGVPVGSARLDRDADGSDVT